MSAPQPPHTFLVSVVDHPWRVILATLLATLCFGYFLQFVGPSMSYKDLFGADFPLLVEYERLQSEYTNDESLLFLIEAKEGDAFAPALLSGVAKLTQELWKTPYSIRVDSITNHQHTEASGDDLTVADMFKQPEDMAVSEIARLRAIAIRDPLTVNRVVNPQGNALSLVISFSLPNQAIGEKPEIMAFVNARADEFRANFPDANVYVGGLIGLDATFLELSTQESALFLLMNVLLVVVLMTLFLKRLKPLLASILIFFLSIAVAMALSGLMGWKITPFTASVPTVVLIIAVADCIHIITAFVHRLNRGIDQREALIEALSANARPVIITSVTTAIGLMTLNFSSSLSVAALGSMSAAGVMAACLLSLTLLPALLSLGTHKSGVRKPLIREEQFASFASGLYRSRIAVLLISAGLAATLIYGLAQNSYNEYFPHSLAEHIPWRQANDFGEKQFGSAYNFSFSIDAGGPGQVAEPEFLAKVDELTNWLRGLPEVTYAKSITDTLKSLNRNLHGDDDAFYRLPEDREQAAQYLLLYETSLPYGLELTDRVNLEKSATKVFAAFAAMSSSEIIAYERVLNEWLDANMAEMNVTWSGVQLMSSHLIDADGRGLTVGAFSGLFVISLLLMVLMRSVRIGLLSMVPNIFPAVFGFGVWGFLHGEIGMGVSVAAGITIGIIVDDTVHFLAKYTSGKSEHGMSSLEAVTYALQQVGPAIVFTTIVLVSGFLAVAAITDLTFNGYMGLVTAMVLSFALLLTLIVLPVLLMMFDRGGPEIISTSEPSTDASRA
jgi:uncharacterized protein